MQKLVKAVTSSAIVVTAGYKILATLFMGYFLIQNFRKRPK